MGQKGLGEIPTTKKGIDIESPDRKVEVAGIGACRIRDAGDPDLVIGPEGS